MKQKNLYSQYKLLKHLDKLIMWEEQGFAYPILVDFDLTNKCNNKCPLCMSFLAKDDTTADFDSVKDIICQLKKIGARGIVFGGGGDPSCHPNFAEIVKFAKKKKMDVGIYTNAYGLSEDSINALINCCSWIRISLDADGPKIYKKTHGMDEEAFNQVINNISKLVNMKNKLNKEVIIGLGYLIAPHTIEGIYNAAKLSKSLGVDYLRFRPFYNWSDRKAFESEEGEKMFSELEKCKKLGDESFSISYPENRCQPNLKSRSYEECHVLHFNTSITPDLKVYPCCPLKNREKYCLGDLTKNKFKDIWLSNRKKEIFKKLDFKDCPDRCMIEGHNELLNAIKKPIAHSNFL